MHIFLICGYGIPRDIFTDENYRTYLSVVFNKMYAISAGKEMEIIPCGGPTAMEPPYEGTEAGIIAKYLRKQIENQKLEQATSAWKTILEDQSLSTLENLVFAKRILDEQKLAGTITIFCEETRRERIVKTAQMIFGSECTVEAIDFDASKNRYLDPNVIQQKEHAALRESLWTLEDKTRLEKHHEFQKQKIEYFRERQAQGIPHVDVVGEWYKKMPEIVKQLMPDHPLLAELNKKNV
ncbi:MAG: YdcF family protein [Patescibacteria group bacterium]|jgi:hypothetical protein